MPIKLKLIKSYNKDGTVNVAYATQETIDYIRKRYKEMKKKKIGRGTVSYKVKHQNALDEITRLHKVIDDLSSDNPYLGYEERTIAPKGHIVETVFAGGATRKVIKECSHMICPDFLRRVGLIFSEGLENYKDKTITYAEVTTARHGIPYDNLLRHLDNHYLRLRAGDTSEDNLAKIGWALQQIAHQEAPNCQHYNILVKPQDRNARPNSLYIG